MTFSPLEILQAGADTRNGTDLELFMQVEDALTPRCEHVDHELYPEFHGGSVRRLVRTFDHPNCPSGSLPDRWLCDQFWSELVLGFICRDCATYHISELDYKIIAEL